MSTILAYSVSILSGVVARFIYGVLFGFLNVITPSFIQFFPERIKKHSNKIYFHILWTSSEFVFAFVTILVFKHFGQTFPGLMIYLLFLSPFFVMISFSMRKPENLFYFNDTIEHSPNDFRRINRREAISRCIGIILCLLII